jgi:hypothetical protein
MNDRFRPMNLITTRARAPRLIPALLLAVFVTGPAGAQSPPAVDPNAAIADPLASLAWLEGCWRGSVNQREFREHWMPLRGGLLLGVSQIVMAGKTQGYEYLRLEARPDGVFYIAVPSGKKEEAFRLTGKTVDKSADRDDEIFTFENPAQEFPRRIIYRRASGGWLYAQVEGKLNGVDRQVIYPMRRIDCATGANIEK